MRIGKLSKRNTFNLLVLIMIVGGITGFIYEEIFYYFDCNAEDKSGKLTFLAIWILKMN